MRIAAVPAIIVATTLLAACNSYSPEGDGAGQPVAVVQPIAQPIAQPADPEARSPSANANSAASAEAAGPSTFLYEGELTQGGWLRGTVPAGTVEARLGETPLAFDQSGAFFAAIDRDAGRQAALVAQLADGTTIESPFAIGPRSWDIEHVNVARRSGGASEAFMRIRRPELARIAAARTADSDTNGWAQDFIWPVTGRISGRFGSQRIYRGEPGSYHTGIDIAPGAGVPFVAPADGVVTLAARDDPFSLEGHLIIIDHGQGLNSAFLHCASIDVREGDRVRQGQRLGTVGMSGRATGPHLHWSLKWHDARLDPLLFTGPMR